MLNDDTISSIDIEEILDTDISEHVRAYLLVVRDIVWNRRTFRLNMTVKGQLLVGLVPANARDKNHICIMYGCSVTVVTISQWDRECFDSKYDFDYFEAKNSETVFDIR